MNDIIKNIKSKCEAKMREMPLLAFVVVGIFTCVVILLPWICIGFGIYVITDFSIDNLISGALLALIGVLSNYIVKPISILCKFLGYKTYKWF